MKRPAPRGTGRYPLPDRWRCRFTAPASVR